MAEQAHLHNFTVERPYGMAYVWEYGAYTYAVRSSIDWRGHGWDTTILIDGSTGRLRELDLPRGQHLGNTISTLLWGIHYGDLRDWLFFRIAIGIFGLVLAMLSYTGFAIWWRKTKVRRIPKRAHVVIALALAALYSSCLHRATSANARDPCHNCVIELGGGPRPLSGFGAQFAPLENLDHCHCASPTRTQQ